MLKINSVQWRFITVITGIVAITAITLSFIFTQVIAHGGNAIMDDALRIAAEDFLERRATDPHARLPESPSIKSWQLDNPALPLEIKQQLAERVSNFNVSVGETHFRAYVFGAEQQRWVILTDMTRRLAVRRNVREVMMVVSATVVLLALAAGFWLSNVVLNPINRMLRATLQSEETNRLEISATSYPDNEIGELARALDAYSLRLQGFVAREQAFASDISHELRTPMAVILSSCEVISTDPSISTVASNRLQRIERAANEMNQMINAILVLAKEPPGTIRDREVSLSDVVRRSAESFQHQIAGKPVHLEVRQDSEVAIYANEALLYTTVSNLIRNAFAYTEHGTIRVVISDRTLAVHNPATGIPTIYLGDHNHYSLSNETADRTSGIGLSLVQRICKHHGWELSVKSSETAGSMVSIVFPT